MTRRFTLDLTESVGSIEYQLKELAGGDMKLAVKLARQFIIKMATLTDVDDATLLLFASVMGESFADVKREIAREKAASK